MSDGGLMNELSFRKLYKEGKEPARRAPSDDPLPAERKGLLTIYRMHIGSALIVLGLVLFALQIISSSDIAMPYNAFAVLLVEDHSGIEEDEEIEDVNILISHYKEAPGDQFVENFQGMADSLETPEGMQVIPVQISYFEAANLVAEGKDPEVEDGFFRIPQYSMVQIKGEDASALLRGLVNDEGDVSGKLFLGPFPHRQIQGSIELVEEDSRRRIDAVLPNSASALQGFVIAPELEIRPNALLLLPSGDVGVGDFFETVRGFAVDTAVVSEELETQYQLFPAIIPSGYRHSLPVFLLTLLGEIVFLAGGYLLLFHLMNAISRKPRKEGKWFSNTIKEGCDLVVRYKWQYSMVVFLIFGFWVWGMVGAYFDPGNQKIMVQTFRSQFSSGGWPFGTIGWALRTGNFLLLAPLIFVNNFLNGSFLFTTLPSLIPIAGGFIINAYRGQVLGFTLSPTEYFFGQSMIPHLFTILLEMQAYLIGAFTSVLLPMALLKPEKFGVENRKQAFIKFFFWQLKILPLVAVVLLIAAVYETIELLLIM